MEPDRIKLNYAVPDFIGDPTVAATEKQTTIGQSGITLWSHFKSGYLFDFIGFDMGAHTYHVWNDKDKGNYMHDGKKSGTRLSIANLKVRFGDDDRHIGFRHGFMELDTMHFGRDKNEWLKDKNYKGSMINAKWGGLNIYGLEVTEMAPTHKRDFFSFEDFSQFDRSGAKEAHTLGVDYFSNYGSIRFARTSIDNYLSTTSFNVATGLPMHMAGFDVPAGKEMDYLFLFQAGGDWQAAKKDFVNPYGKHEPDHDANSAFYTVGAKMDNFFFGMTYLQVGKNEFYDSGWGGGQGEGLAGYTFINNFNRPNTKTFGFVSTYDWTDHGARGLSTMIIFAQGSDIDMDRVNSSGNTTYGLIGRDRYHEALFQFSYTGWGSLDGLVARITTGFENNIGSMRGWGAYIDYDISVF